MGGMGNESILYDIVMVETPFVQIHKNASPSVDPSGNYGLWMIMVCYRDAEFDSGGG